MRNLYLLKISGLIICLTFCSIAYTFGQSSGNNAVPESLKPPQDSEDSTQHKNDDVSDQSAFDWLVRLSKQVSTQNYQVSFVVSRPDQETLPYLWRHAVLKDDSVMEQLSLLNGPGFEQIRHNNVVSFFEPGYPPYSVKGLALDGPIPYSLLHAPERLLESYDFMLIGNSRISGRYAQQIRVISKDKTRFGYHIWLDESSGMLLKMNMMDLSGQILEQLQVTEMTISNDVVEYFEKIQSENLPRVTTMKPTPQRQHHWHIASMPIGMKQVKQDIHRLAITGDVVEYSLLSDGLVDVSIYVQAANEYVQPDLTGRQGPNTVLTRTNGNIQVTVVGKIPPTTASQIANAISLKQP